jgi:hypothetical protein
MPQLNYMVAFFGQDGGFTDHVDGGTSRFDQNGVIYEAMCANCSGGAVFQLLPVYGQQQIRRPLNCNLAMVKIALILLV